MVDSVVIVRHAHRLDTEDPSWVYSSPMPWDPPLSQAGQAATVALVNKIAATVPAGTTPYVFASPFLRCVQTALPLAQALGSKLRLASVFGEWMTPDYFTNGAPPSDSHAGIAAASYSWVLQQGAASSKNVDFTWNIQQLGHSGNYGEEWTEMHDRVISGLAQLLKDDTIKGTLIIVSHGSVCNSLLSELRHVPQVEEIALASYAVVEQ